MKFSAQLLGFTRFLAFLLLFSSYLLLCSARVDAIGLKPGSVWEWDSKTLESSQKGGLTNIAAVSVGRIHSLALRKDGTVWAWGRNDYGQLGNGEVGGETREPIQVKSSQGGYLTNVKAIAAGEIHSLALKEDGTVWTWGAPMDGITSTLTATKEKGLSDFFDIIAIDAGGTHSIALKSDGSVFAWGANNFGQIGVGCTLYNCSKIPSPRKVMSNAISVAAGCCHSLAVKKDGTVWGWGRLYDGQLGSILNVGFPEQPSPTQIPNISGIKSVWAKDLSSAALSEEGTVFEWGAGRAWPKDTNPRQIPELTNVIEADVAYSNDLGVGIGIALKKDGTVWQWNVKDLIAVQVPNLSGIDSISAGRYIPSLAAVSVSLDVPIQPFLDLPWDYEAQGKSFEDVAFNPASWFDHRYPLQNIPCCIQNVTIYTGKEKTFFYKSHNGYDYGLQNGVQLNTPVLAAASGIATFKSAKNSGGAGNVIKIDHGNSYQTWYEHLGNDDLIVSREGETVSVDKGQMIGRVGMTGNTSGPHIHFSVFKDANNNNNFDDDYPYGVNDPLGWEGEKTDPWTEWSDGNRNGTPSFNLFVPRTPPKSTPVPTNGATIVLDAIQIAVPSGALDTKFSLTYKNGPFEFASVALKSIVPSFFLDAIDTLNQKVTEFLEPIKITYNYQDADLFNINEDTLRIYFLNPQTNQWEALSSILDKENKTITAETTHFSHFAIMGEVKDNIPPTTDVILHGDKGEDNWYRSTVSVELNGKDNDNGVGLQYTLYTVNGDDWFEYKEPLVFENEGIHSITYQSFDKAENTEDRKTITFHIDKTPPEAKISASQDRQGLIVEGIDNNPTRVEKQNRQFYAISDLSGNKLVIDIKDRDRDRDKDEDDEEDEREDDDEDDKKNKEKLVIQSLKYNEDPPIILAKNSFVIKYKNKKRQDTLIIKKQEFVIKKEIKIKIKYDQKKNQSVITTKLHKEKKVKEAKDGLTLLQLFTEKGTLRYSY